MAIDMAHYYTTSIRYHPLPAKGYDPSTERDEAVLRGYGLPTVGNVAINPAAAAFKRSFLTPPVGHALTFLRVEGALSAGISALVLPPTSRSAQQPQQKSANWSGGYVSPRNGRSFVSVMGKWTVPAVSRPPDGAVAEYQSSTWIGLDGQRLYRDSTLPQIGTFQIWTDTTSSATYSTWFQWWARGQHEPFHNLPMPVTAGDEVLALLTVLDERWVRFNLKNETQAVILQAFDVEAPGQCRVSGSTAEWIMERPSPLNTDGWHAYHLPVYADFAFSECVAQSVAPGAVMLQDHDLLAAQLIRMYEIAANPTAMRMISTAQRILEPDQKLTLSYVGP